MMRQAADGRKKGTTERAGDSQEPLEKRGLLRSRATCETVLRDAAHRITAHVNVPLDKEGKPLVACN
jgi:hypothetical protein